MSTAPPEDDEKEAFLSHKIHVGLQARVRHHGRGGAQVEVVGEWALLAFKESLPVAVNRD